MWPANLFTDRVILAQENLALNLRRDSKNGLFRELYGRKSTRKMLERGDYGFQINVWKLSEELRDALQDERLAWQPASLEPYDVQGDYVEVHPQVGQAVMSTLAVACSESEGLDIVGDHRSGALHRCLLEKDLNGIYDQWLGSEKQIDPPTEATGEELMDFILGIPADPSVLTPAKIREITKEREPIEDLIEKLRTHAGKIPRMDSSSRRDQFFQDVASDVQNDWKKDKLNFSSVVREFFNAEVGKLTVNSAGRIAEKLLPFAGATAAGWFGSLLQGGIIGVGGGLLVGLVAHAGTSWHKAAKRSRDSPYRFLTTLEEAGVVLFRSEVPPITTGTDKTQIKASTEH